MNLLAKIFPAIADIFDPFIHLKKTATDKDYFLVNKGDQWMVLTGTGKIVAASKTSVEMLEMDYADKSQMELPDTLSDAYRTPTKVRG